MQQTQHQVVIERTWTDAEPDTLYISVEIDDETGEAYTVFSGNATWLTDEQVVEVVAWLQYCRATMHRINDGR